MKPVFVDTSAFVALASARDKNHEAAVAELERLAAAQAPLVTSDYIFDETVTLSRLRLGHEHAIALGERLLASTWCRVLDVTPETRTTAWAIFQQYHDQTFSFTDCTSFGIMRALGAREGFTFDRRDFLAAGFIPLPTPHP